MTIRPLPLGTAALLLALAAFPCRAEADSAKPEVAPEAAPAVDPEAAAKLDRALAEILRAEDRRQVDDSLRGAARDPHPEVRRRAFQALGRIGAPGTRPLVEPGLKDAVAEVRVEAAFALGLLLEPAAVPALEAAASDASDLVRASAAEALGRIHTKETIRPIVALLADKSAAVRVEAALAAWQVPDATTVVTPLLTMLDSADHTTRLPATYALARMASAASAPATSGPAPARPAAKDVRRIRDRLMALVAAPEAEVRMQVARGLHTPLVPQELSTLAALARDSDSRVRVNAIRSLCYPGAMIDPILSRALKDSDVRVSYTAAEGLAKVGGDGAGRILAAGFEKTRHPWLLEAAMGSIAVVAPALVPQTALTLQNHPVAAVRAAVAKALVTRPEPEALQIERAYLVDPSPLVVIAAIPAVVVATENLVTGLESVANSPDAVVRAALAEAAGDRLGKTGIEERPRADALAFLDKIWQRSGRDSLPDARLAVIDAAARSGRDPRVHAILEKGLEDADRIVRLRAIAKLRSVFDEDASAKAGAASDRPLEEYLSILEWAKTGRAAIVTVQRPGYDPGRFTLRLDSSVAPMTAWNFAKLAEKGFYDGLTIHRVVPNFVFQDGDPRGDGYGGPGHSIRDEVGHLRFAAGAVGMASDGKDTAGSQWFVTLSAQPHLDGRYTAFGEVVQNLAGVAGLIEPGDRIVSIRVYEGTGAEPLPPL